MIRVRVTLGFLQQCVFLVLQVLIVKGHDSANASELVDTRLWQESRSEIAILPVLEAWLAFRSVSFVESILSTKVAAPVADLV
jgi:hypothetical protein